MQDAPGDRVELFEEYRIARLRCSNQGIVERAIGADRARLMFAREVACEPRHQARGILGIGREHLDDVLDGYCVMVRMPTIEVGNHGDRGVADLRLSCELASGMLVMPITE